MCKCPVIAVHSGESILWTKSNTLMHVVSRSCLCRIEHVDGTETSSCVMCRAVFTVSTALRRRQSALSMTHFYVVGKTRNALKNPSLIRVQFACRQCAFQSGKHFKYDRLFMPLHYRQVIVRLCCGLCMCVLGKPFSTRHVCSYIVRVYYTFKFAVCLRSRGVLELHSASSSKTPFDLFS